MKIIAHRGAWCRDELYGLTQCEKNSREAFVRAVKFGFGIETDFRDICGKIVISHNPPKADAMPAEEFFELLQPGQIVAVNVKADGLAEDLRKLWQRYAPNTQPFAFDMSVPDTLGFVKARFPFYERRSEYEKDEVWSTASGIWLDGFHSIWFDSELITSLLKVGKPVCIVSPELHGRDYQDLWEKLKLIIMAYPNFKNYLQLCTDAPYEAQRFFNSGK